MSRQTVERSADYRRGYAAGFAAGQRSLAAKKIRKPEDLSKMRIVKDAYWVGTSYDGYADGYPVIDEWVCSNCGREAHCEESELDRYCGYCGCAMSVKEWEE